MRSFDLGPTTYWERVAATRWGKYVSEIEKTAIVKAHHMNGRPTIALEVGCEGGRWSKLLSDLGWGMICTDVNKDVLDICQKRIPAAKCILAHPDDKILPSETASVGLLLCIEVYPIIESEWFLTEANRTLSKDGIIVGVFLNRSSLRGLFVRVRERLSKRYRFRHYQQSYPNWKKNMVKHGFRLIYERGFCWFPLGRSSDSRLVPLFTGIESMLHLGRAIDFSPWIVFIAQKSVE